MESLTAYMLPMFDCCVGEAGDYNAILPQHVRRGPGQTGSQAEEKFTRGRYISIEFVALSVLEITN